MVAPQNKPSLSALSRTLCGGADAGVLSLLRKLTRPASRDHYDLPLRLGFSICLGLGSGINSIAQGSLPLYLFGSDGYGALTGKMAAARLAAGAAAPFGFAATMEQFGIGASLALSAALGSIGIAAFVAIALSARTLSVGVATNADRNRLI